MILASNNKGKLQEIKAIFKEWDIKTLRELNLDVEVEEDQDTFKGNALKKAKEIYEITKQPTISDDSGLCIDEKTTTNMIQKISPIFVLNPLISKEI